MISRLFLANGVDYNDAVAITGRVREWGWWCEEWSREARRYEALGEEALAKGRMVTAAEGFVRASLYYHFGQLVFFGEFHLPGVLRISEAGRPAPCVLLVPGMDSAKEEHHAFTERIIAAASEPKALWMFEEGNHVCENVAPVYRPRVADWLAERLSVGGDA